jgi:hypothetical protein
MPHSADQAAAPCSSPGMGDLSRCSNRESPDDARPSPTRLDEDTPQDRIDHLALAVKHRTIIGQATGILMERYGLDADAAFRTLLRLSSERERKVYKIAQELVRTGRVAGL